MLCRLNRNMCILHSWKCMLIQSNVTFNSFVNLETHIQLSHEEHQELQWDKCEKHFELKWRLSKKMTLHTEKSVKHCHYSNNSEKCLFKDIGCKFLHSVYKNCIYNQKWKKLPPQTVRRGNKWHKQNRNSWIWRQWNKWWWEHFWRKRSIHIIYSQK